MATLVKRTSTYRRVIAPSAITSTCSVCDSSEVIVRDTGIGCYRESSQRGRLLHLQVEQDLDKALQTHM